MIPPPLVDLIDRNRGNCLHLQFDFDGTLVPITSDPDQCFLDPQLRRRFRQLLLQPGLKLAVLSGRSLQDLSSRIGVPGLTLSGNHGLEIAANGQVWRHPDAEVMQPRLRQVAEQARLLMTGVPGAVVEDKGLSLSLHYRQVPAAWKERMRTRLSQLEDSLAGRSELTFRHGRKVLEIMPRLNWNKGSAAQLLCNCEGGNAGAEFLYAGDDVSDEDVFRSFPVGITIKIGESSRATDAHYRFDSPATLRGWLLTESKI